MDDRTCSSDSCEEPQVARGWCSTHYAQKRRAGAFRHTPCAVDGCEESAVTRDMCNTHYHRQYRLETGRSVPAPSVEERFWARVDKSAGRDACWPWLGRKTSKGYGSFCDGPHRALATRWLLGEMRGEPLSGSECALHTCDNPPCTNPAHLYVGTKAQNTQDMLARGRAPRTNSKKTHCPQGHPYDEWNTKKVKNGWRECRTCDIARQRRLRRRRIGEVAANGQGGSQV